MEVVRVAPGTPDDGALALAEQVLLSGRLLIYPTDTLYALGCRASDGRAALRVRDAKGRDDAKPLPLVAADVEQVEAVCMPLSSTAAALGRRFWPGPLTLVIPVRSGLASEVTAGGASVAIRVPALALVRALCRRVGPLISTSANRTGEEPPRTCEAAVAGVGAAAALALDGGPGAALASTIVDLTGVAPRLLREGGIAWAEIEAALRGESP